MIRPRHFDHPGYGDGLRDLDCHSDRSL